jgi:hypothetical protein
MIENIPSQGTEFLTPKIELHNRRGVFAMQDERKQHSGSGGVRVFVQSTIFEIRKTILEYWPFEH